MTPFRQSRGAVPVALRVGEPLLAGCSTILAAAGRLGDRHINQPSTNRQSSLQSIRRLTHSVATVLPAFPTDQIDQ